MDLLELTSIPIIGDLKGNGLPSPEEYDYWKSRSNRTFYIDYIIGEYYRDDSQDNRLVELGKTIIQMNIEEKDIPKEDLKPIYIFLFSPGGDLDQSLSFCDICTSSRIPIITIGMGTAMSGAFLILLAGSKRYAFNHCQMLVHSGSAGFQGTAEQIEEAQKNYKKQLNEMKEYILSRTDIDEKVFSRNRNKDWYLKRDEILNYHIIDKYIDNIEDIF